MQKLLEIKEHLSKLYGKNSKYINKIAQFLLALCTFTFISQNVGYSTVASNPIMTVALSVICTFLPVVMTVVLAMIVVIMQFYTLSLGIACVAGALFLVMYALYLRFTPGKAIILLLVPIAFMFKIPVVIPILFGLIGSPICILPIAMGTVVYYMVDCVKSYSTLLETVGESGMKGQLAIYAQQLFTNREMWSTVIAFAICLLIVYSMRRMAMEYSWEIGIISSALGYLITKALAYVIMDIELLYLPLIIEIIVAIVIAFIVKFFVFSVDYTRTEYLQFEDDEYYYYVTAVPKVSVATPQKVVKRINECQKTGVIDVEQIKKKEQLEKQNAEESKIQKIIEDELGSS